MSFWCTLQSPAEETEIVSLQSFLGAVALRSCILFLVLHLLYMHQDCSSPSTDNLAHHVLIHSFGVIKANHQSLHAQMHSERPSKAIQYPPAFCWISMPRASTGVPPYAKSPHSWEQVQCLVVFSSSDTHIIHTNSAIVFYTVHFHSIGITVWWITFLP